MNLPVLSHHYPMIIPIKAYQIPCCNSLPEGNNDEQGMIMENHNF